MSFHSYIRKVKPFFHWQYSGVAIPLLFAAAFAMIAIPYDLTFNIGRIFFVLFGAWTLGWAVTWQKRGTYVLVPITMLVMIGGLYLTGYLQLRHDLESPEGMLYPANLPTPKNGCDAYVPKGTPMLLFGGLNFVATKLPQAAVVANGQEIVGMYRDNGSLAVSLKVEHFSGSIVSVIERNHYYVNTTVGNRFRRPDRSSLIVEDIDGKEVLNIVLLNRDAILVKGLFRFPMLTGYGPWDGFKEPGPGCFQQGSYLVVQGNKGHEPQ